jgi:integrase
MKELQDWMGHKSMATTADIYSHVQHKSKQRLSESISSLISSG